MRTLNMCHVEHELASLHFPSFPRNEGKLSNYRCIPIRANFTPNTAVIFINQSREELGVL
jgi:hypothetical protein